MSLVTLTLMFVGAVRQEEKRRLLRRNGELKKECDHLEEEDKKLNDTLKVRNESRSCRPSS